MEEIIVPIMIFSVPLAFIFTRFYLKLQELKINGGGPGGGSSEMKKELGTLMAENEEIKERLRNLESILSDDSLRIKLEYEKEQLMLDKNNKSIYK